MKIIIIRHGKVNYTWSKRYNSQTFDNACKEYDLAHIESINKPYSIDCNNIYISNFLRSFETAQALFTSKEFIKLDSIGEVPICSFVDLNVQLPLWIWNMIGRIQWYFNVDRQKESRCITNKRANSVIAELEKRKTDCVLVTHGFFMKILISRLKKAGYSIIGQTVFGFSNLQMVTAERKL